MANVKAKPAKKIVRVDRLEQVANVGKQALLRDLIQAWRRSAGTLAAEQWDLFYRTGRFHNKTSLKYPDDPLGGARIQMCRFQVVGILKGFTESLADRFKTRVSGSTLEPEQKHRLHRINRAGAWYAKQPPTYKEGPQPTEQDLKLARTIFRDLLKRHRKPSMKAINAVLDRRTVTVSQENDGSYFHYWLNLATLEKQGRGYRRIAVPLLSNPFAEARPGERLDTWQLNMNRAGAIHFGRLTDVSEPYQQLRQRYQVGVEKVGLDFGLKYLLATSEGDLLGRDLQATLARYDRTLTAIARHQQRQGKKPRDSRRYRRLVSAVRGFLKSEINRCFNRLVALHRPGHLIVERLDFRGGGLSRRLNRIISNCGRGIVKTKLVELEARYGITNEDGQAAYSSQECDNPICGYVDKRNRNGEVFKCRACGKQSHADIKAAKVMRDRCSVPSLKLPSGKTKALDVLVKRYIERFPHPRCGAGRTRNGGIPPDPRATNPYFRGWAKSVTLNPETATA